MMNDILFTHDDMDGAGCRIVFELSHINEYEEKGIVWDVVNCSNSNINEKVREYLTHDNIGQHTIICFADICPDIDLAKEIIDRGHRICVWDHHRTNFPIQQVVSTAEINPDAVLTGKMESGTSLLYNHMIERFLKLPTNMFRVDKALNDLFVNTHSGKYIMLQEFVDTIRSYDTWEWKETGNMKARHLQTLFSLLGIERFVKRYVERISSANLGDPIIAETDLDFVNAKLQREQEAIDKFTPDDVVTSNIKGYKTALTVGYLGANFSELANQFLVKYPDYDLFVNMLLSNDGCLSFRTAREDFDTGEIIAKPIGGGGHPKASGAPLPKVINDIIYDLMKCVIKGKRWKVTIIQLLLLFLVKIF